MEWTPEIKLALLCSGGLLVSSFIFVAIMLHSIGGMSNMLQHMENIFTAETELRQNAFVAMLKQNKLRLTNQMEHERRQEALLAIPLVRGQNKGGLGSGSRS